ncbi:hypothetical protein RhiirB3_465590 [Rhizophagus irregularis]|nr:hypothetical protein RhiirB3_465590 [Rhizophagus irregularis]
MTTSIGRKIKQCLTLIGNIGNICRQKKSLQSMKISYKLQKKKKKLRYTTMFARETHFVNGFLNQYGPDFYKSLKDTNLPLRTPRKKNGKIPRPPNSFILFRQYVSEYAKRRGLTFEYENEQIVLKSSQAYLGKVSSCLWVNLPIDTRLIFKQMSETVKYFHELNYPEYRYSPNRQAHIFKAG